MYAGRKKVSKSVQKVIRSFGEALRAEAEKQKQEMKKMPKKKKIIKKKKAAVTGKGRTDPAMAKALAFADSVWPDAKKAPIAGFETFPVGTYTGRLVEASLESGQYGPYVKWGHTVADGDLVGRTCNTVRWLKGREEEQTLQNLQRLAGDIEAHGFDCPEEPLSVNLPKVLKAMKEAAPFVEFRITHWGDDNQNVNKVILQTIDEDEVAALKANLESGSASTESADTDTGDGNKPPCFGEFEDDDSDCKSCEMKDECPPKGGGGEAVGETEADIVDESGGDEEETLTVPDDAPNCYGEHEADDDSCQKCTIKEGCKEYTEADSVDEEEGEAESSAPDLPELLAFVEEQELGDVSPKDKGTAEKVMKKISKVYSFDLKNLSMDDLDLLERFPEEYKVEVSK